MMNKSMIVKPIFNLFASFIPQSDTGAVTPISDAQDDRELLEMINKQTRINDLTYSWQYVSEGKIQGAWLQNN